jgi:UDP-glucose 4-epimerase
MRVTGVEVQIEELPVPTTFVDRVVLDTTRFRSEFGSFPLTTLDDGIRSTYQEIRSHIGA